MIRWPLYPFFLSMLVVLGIYTINMDEVKLVEVMKPSLICLLATAAMMLLLGWRWKQWAGLLTSAFIFVMILPYLWAYARVSYFILEITGFFLVVYLVSQKGRISALIKATPYLNFVCLTLLLPSMGAFALHTSYLKGDSVNYDTIPLVSENKPDIYYVIIDRYARADILESNFGYDDSAFVAGLRDRGFYVADQSNANYTSTAISLLSSMDMEYLPVLSSYNAVYDALQKPLVSMSLKESGYTLIRMGSWWAPTSHSYFVDINYNLTAPEDFSAIVFDQTLVEGLFNIAEKIRGTGHSLWENTNYKWQKLSEIPGMEEPTFTFAHFLTCHSPYTFNADGTANYREGESDEAYRDAITFSNMAILRWLDSIPEDAVVIIQADEGAWPVEPNMANWTPEDWKQKFAILNAIRCPGAELWPTITPVNTFRVVFNELFNTDLEILPDKCLRWAPGIEGMEVTFENS